MPIKGSSAELLSVDEVGTVSECSAVEVLIAI